MKTVETLLATASLLLVPVLVPAPALACGGTFCGQPAPLTPPEPVDQSAERILFLVRDDGTVTAHVSIQYAGGADSFAWVVPVPGIPEVEDSAVEVFQKLDDASRLRPTLPPPATCAVSTSGDDGCGCAQALESAGGGGSATAAEDGFDPEEPVTVFAHDFTANYEYHVVGATETSELVGWLQDNGYNVSDNMTPTMDVYNSPEMRFLALKLQDGKEVSDIVPIAMTYQAAHPMIPIRLTAVAAQPQMGILVWILADQVYEPTGGYDVISPDPEEILFDVFGTTNYFDWAARKAAEANGKLFVREYSGTNPLEGQTISGFTMEGGSMSRFYTRMSPEDMTEDPTFEVDPEGTLQGAVLDLSGHPTLFGCTSNPPPSRCAFNYCGRDAECTVVDARIGCLCPPGKVGQPLRGPDGSDRVTCVPAENPFGITPEAGGAGTEFDPCNDVDCGAGTCWLKSGFPTCDCDPGAVACLEPDGSVLCIAPAAPPTTFGPGAGRESAPPEEARADDYRPQTRFAIPAWLPLLLVWFAGVQWRRRRPAEETV